MKLIIPDIHGNATYTNQTVKDRDGVQLSGEYELLNLAGLFLPNGPLFAAGDSRARSVILSGSSFTYGARPEHLVARALNSQEIYAKNISLGEIEDYMGLLSIKNRWFT